MEEKKKQSNRAIAIPIIIIIIIIIVILYFLLNRHETYTSEGDTNDVVTALDCTAGRLENATFVSSTANVVTNQVKITFNNDKIDKLFYHFEGTYRDHETAEYDSGIFLANYYKHMSASNQSYESLTPTFVSAKTKTRISLYVKGRNAINKAVAKFFFVNGEDFEEYIDYSRDQVANYYQKQGFSCEKQN